MSRITRIGGVSRQLLAGSSLLFLLGTSLGHASEAVVLSPAHSAVRTYSIPAQDLASALLVFGQQSGLQISASSQLVQQHQAPALQGNFSAVEALSHLLAGSGLSWSLDAQGVRLQAPAQEIGRLELGNTLIQSHQTPPMGTSTVGRKQIERLPAGNGDITSLLKINPNVQFDNAQQSSKSPGELSPANVSINGAQFYQNAFLVDGMGMNNDINPGDSTHNQVSSVPGRSQGLALDTDLLDSITVRDSNISAAYGGFNGGVIEANTRAPSKDFHGKISYQTTRSDWTSYHVDSGEREKFDGASSSDTYAYQPEFEKHIVRATLEGHLTEDFGLLANITQKTSTIPVHVFNYLSSAKSSYGESKQDQERQAQNFFLKGVWRASEDLDLEASLTYAPESATYYRDNALNTGYSIESGGTLFNFKSTQQASLAKITQQLSWSRLENSRDSDADDWNNWKQNSVKDWGTGSISTEGGYGDIEQSQDSLSYKLDVQWDALEFMWTSHRFRSGLELQRQSFEYNRSTESNVNVYALMKAGTQCADASTLNGNTHCDSEAGQFVSSLTQYRQGNFSFDINSWAAYLEDEIRVSRVMLRPGVRIDNDDYMNKTTVAPRFALEWDLFDNRHTLFTAGANRYYGRNSASWALREGVRDLQYGYSRAKNPITGKNIAAALDNPWVEDTHYRSDSEFQELDIAYDDELTFGLTQVVKDVELGVKWVGRRGRDQVRSEKVVNATDSTKPSTYTRYTNEGKSDSETLTFTVSPLKPLELWGSRNTLSLAADYSHRTSNFSGYADEYEAEKKEVYYQGRLIHISELPPANFNHDWTYRLTTMTEVPSANLTWSNFLRYRSGLDTLKTDSQNKIDGYNQVYDVSYAKSLTWDLRLSWELPLAKDHAAFVNLDVFNVTDRVIASGNVNSNAAFSGTVYETGRQYWLEVGYRF